MTVTGAGGLNLTPAPDLHEQHECGDGDGELHAIAGDANHSGSNDSKTFAIDKAASTTTVTLPASPFTYTGAAHDAGAVTVTGAGGLSLTPAAVYTNNVNAGTATASSPSRATRTTAAAATRELRDRQGDVDDRR